MQTVANIGLRSTITRLPKKGTIRISAHQEEDHVVVCVADTGPGIPPEHLRKIFDRFWRVPETRKQGTGLGLSIARVLSKRIVARSGLKANWAKAVRFSSPFRWHIRIPANSTTLPHDKPDLRSCYASRGCTLHFQLTAALQLNCWRQQANSSPETAQDYQQSPGLQWTGC